ncbi:hypothetical protein SOCE26_014470 [Sorangium cellulosum]|uniref:DUF2169 domain-containing protein n=1 Tax=Sorangium cellulosum TaxID=56 RepID=A0A2L0EL74_SORCE|nr:DUF2169 domain-containing protein [Sorangium cellulosum]AUX40051.1 hypothetical protein SOCE26_014470 [Sorangium cellulosum]
MRVSSACPLRVASLVWRPRPEALALTVVCKATFVLEPGLSPLAPEQEAPWEADVPWGDDPGASLWAASDLAPFKRRVDVLAVGHAHAPRGEPAASLVARLAIGAVDKRIEVHGGPADPLPRVGFGPIAPSWPERAAKLRRHAATFRHDAWAEQPLPEDIDAGYFNAAPPDQQLDQLPAGEPIVLEHLHPAHPQLTTVLEGVIPRAMLLRGGSGPQEMRMRCDTLWIDADRGICTLTWRGAVPLRHAAEDVTVIVTAERPQGGGDVAATLVPARAPSGAAVVPAVGPPSPAVAADAVSTFVPALRASDPGGALPFTAAPQALPFAPAPAPDDDVEPPAGAPAAAVDDAATTLATGLVPAAEPLPFQAARLPAGSVPAQKAAQPWQARAAPGSAPPGPGIDLDALPPATEPAAQLAEEIAAAATLPPALTGTLLPDELAGAAAEQATAERPAVPAFLAGTAPLPPLPPPLPPLPSLPPLPPLPAAPASPEALAPAAVWPPVSPAPAPLRSEVPPAPAARWSEVPPAPAARWSEVPPAPVVLRSEAPPAPAPPAPVVLRSEAPPAPAVPPEEVPVERFAAISAEIAEQRAPRAEVLRAHELNERAWAAVERHFRPLLEKDARAAGRLRAAYDAAYVAAVERFRGPITLPEYARIAVGLERGEPGEVLDALAIQRPALMPIVRVWTKKAAGHMALSAELMALLETLRAG